MGYRRKGVSMYVHACMSMQWCVSLYVCYLTNLAVRKGATHSGHFCSTACFTLISTVLEQSGFLDTYLCTAGVWDVVVAAAPVLPLSYLHGTHSALESDTKSCSSEFLNQMSLWYQDKLLLTSFVESTPGQQEHAVRMSLSMDKWVYNEQTLVQRPTVNYPNNYYKGIVHWRID